jgi:hypothetical protein
MVAALVLMVGVLGTFVMIDGANRATRDNNARASATALTREILEQARTVDYEKVTAGTLLTELRNKPELGGTVANGVWKLNRKSVEFAITSTICTFDDPIDGLGVPGPANPCPAGNTQGTTGTTDSNPDDFRRVSLAVQWTRGTKVNTIQQTSQINNPGGGIGPRILTFPNPFGTSQTTTGTSIALSATTTSTHLLTWSADDGRPAGRGTLTGPRTAWTWNWPIGTAGTGTPRVDWVVDGAYTIDAQPFDSRGVPGEARVATVLLNRIAPLAPASVRGGRSGGGSGSSNLVEMDWPQNIERDVIGYRVRRVFPDAAPVPICPPSNTAVIASLECADSSPPSGSLRYEVVAVDRTDLAVSNSTPREGTARTLSVGSSAGYRLDRPTITAVGTVNGKPELTIAPPADSNGGADVLFYRIYRDGTRYDRTAGNGSVYHDPAPRFATHEYRVSAVHTSYNEGKLSDPRTW